MIGLRPRCYGCAGRLTLVYLERFFRKICPAMISMIVVPFCSLLISWQWPTASLNH